MARQSPCFLFLSVLACLVSLAPVLAQSNGILKVTVTDNRGFPDPNAALTLVSEDRVRKAKVDKAGEFEFTNLSSRTYELEISSPSFKDITLPNVQITSEDRKVLTIREELYSTPPRKPETTCTWSDIDGLPGLGDLVAYEERTGNVNFTGTIADAFRSKPIRDATITLFKSESTDKAFSTASSDDKGKFEFSDVAPGNYTFSVSREGYYTAPPGLHFWITRENLTRIGSILLFSDRTQDLCGSGIIMIPAIYSIPIPAPDLVPPK